MLRKQTVFAPLFVRVPFPTAEEKAEFEQRVGGLDGMTAGQYLLALIREDIKKSKKAKKRFDSLSKD